MAMRPLLARRHDAAAAHASIVGLHLGSKAETSRRHYIWFRNVVATLVVAFRPAGGSDAGNSVTDL